MLILKEIRNEFIKTFPQDEWVNLIITIVNAKNGVFFYFYVNGENHVTPYKIENLSLKKDVTIKYIEFFNNFYGEVSSIFMFSQKEHGNPGVNNSRFLSNFKNYKEGLWKKKIIDSFFKLLPNYESINTETSKTKVLTSVNTKTQEKKRTLWDNLVFVFTPINYYVTKPGFVEDSFGKYQLQFSGNIKNHHYTNYQKKLMLVCGFSNFYPIAEIFLIYPETLTEANFEIFLKTIGSLLNFRKQNLKSVKETKLFKIMSMFMEKYPNKVYTEKILNALDSLGKTLFINNLESICSNYFNYILLNEKILSKYNENLQIKFWNKLFLFCQSDITQIEIFLNINRLCLILRFYDRNKYKEMCCQEHLNLIKEKYIGSKKVMNPTMTKKLSYLKNIMDLIIDSQEPSNALAFFKLLTLDLSPCLTKFILNIFIKAFNKSVVDDKWKDKFIEQLIQAKYEVIIANTFIHALPDVRMELLRFVFLIHMRMINSNKNNNLQIFEKMIKTCLLPEKMFYYNNKITESPDKQPENNEIKTETSKKDEEKEMKTSEVHPKEEQPKEQPPKEEPPKEEPPKEEPKKEEPKKDEPNKEDTKKVEVKEDEKKNEDTK